MCVFVFVCVCVCVFVLGGCAQHIEADGKNLNAVACCGDVIIHSSTCSVDPCVLQRDVEELKRRH